MPNDPDDTLARVEDGSLRVGLVAGQAHATIVRRKLPGKDHSADPEI